MSDPKKSPQPPASPTPAEVSSELEKAKAELKALEEAQELAKVKTRIDVIKHGGKSPERIARLKEMEDKRAKTYTFVGEDGKKYAKYQTKELRFHNNALVKAGSIMDFPWDALPGESLLPVAPVKPSDDKAFAPKEA